MNTFYRELEERDTSRSCWAVTVLDGRDAGKKWLADAPVSEYDGGRVFCECVRNVQKLVVCGGGHVSIPIIQIAKLLEFHVTVLEDRPKFADHVRAAGADEVICDAFEKGLEQIEGDADTYFVIVTRGHRYDEICLEKILQKANAYVGMMGSRRRVAIVKDQLEERGTKRALLDAVHTPIGLKIGAETPAEIAVSIFAEIIQVKNQVLGCGGYSKELMEAVCGETYSRLKKVLATIISRKGSAPRGVGTKMVIAEDGSLVGTIGGGCAESEVISKALLMLREENRIFQICTVELTSEAAEDEGMVCGGRIEVMLEIL